MKVSFVVPIYNKKAYLKECIDSILNQSYADIEILLIDDGSTDGSGELCDEMADEYEQIYVIHQENKGVSSARNTGIECAKGEWIAFVDADDWIHRDYVQVFQSYMRQNVDICMGEEFSEKEKNHTEIDAYVDVLDKKELQNFERGLLNKYAAATKVHLTSACGKLYRTAFLREYQIGFPTNLTRSEDAMFNQYAYYYAKKAIVIHKPIYYYRAVATSVSRDYSSRILSDYEKHLELIKKFLIKTDRWETWNLDYQVRAVFHFMYCVTLDYCHDNNPNKYKARKQFFLEGAKRQNFSQAFHLIQPKSFSIREKVLFYCIRYKNFWLINLLAYANKIYERVMRENH